MCKGINKKKVCVVSSQAIAGGVVVVVVIEVREREREICVVCVCSTTKRERGQREQGGQQIAYILPEGKVERGEGLYYKS